VADLLQVTIAFVLKIFSFSDKKKVFDMFSTGIVGMQHAAVERAKFGITGVVD